MENTQKRLYKNIMSWYDHEGVKLLILKLKKSEITTLIWLVAILVQAYEDPLLIPLSNGLKLTLKKKEIMLGVIKISF